MIQQLEGDMLFDMRNDPTQTHLTLIGALTAQPTPSPINRHIADSHCNDTNTEIS